MPKLRSLALPSLALALALATSACGGGDCEQLYETMKKCDKGDRMGKVSKSEFVEGCQKAKDDPKFKDELEAAMTCAKEDSCEKVEACQKAQRGKLRAKEVTEAAAAGKWKDAFDHCTLMADHYADATFKAECAKVFANADKLTGEDLSSVMYRCKAGDEIKQAAPDFEQACKALADKQLAAAQKAAIEARDAGKNDYKACSELKSTAEIVGGDAVAAAQRLCDELGAAEDAKKAIDEARASIAAKKASVPFRCDSAAGKLGKLDTEWAKQTLDELFKACYVELGAVAIDARAKDAKYSCPYDIKKVKDAVARYDLATKYPALAETLKKLPAKCK
jgi:hypothetical protein